MGEKKIIGVSVSEIVIEFGLNRKCRGKVEVRSLCDTEGVGFKVQTSSPNKFLVNPPSGVIPPLSTITFQIVLKPQPHLPSAYPRSPSDRFLIRATKLNSSSSSLPPTTQDLKLKVAFVGPILLQHAISCGDTETVKKLIKRSESSLIHETSCSNELFNSWEQQGEAVLNAARRGELEKLKFLLNKGAPPTLADQYGFTALHVAALKGHNQVIQLLLDLDGVDINCRDVQGQTPLHLAVEGGTLKTVELLISRGADINLTTTTAATPLYIARTMGYDSIYNWILHKREALSS